MPNARTASGDGDWTAMGNWGVKSRWWWNQQGYLGELDRWVGCDLDLSDCCAITVRLSSESLMTRLGVWSQQAEHSVITHFFGRISCITAGSGAF